MINVNFFSANRFELVLETNSNYLIDCFLLYGLNKKVLENSYAVELLINDFKQNYKNYCVYSKDKNGKNIPFSIYDMEYLFRLFIDKDGNYCRKLNTDIFSLKVKNKHEYELLKKENRKDCKIEFKAIYFDNIELEKHIKKEKEGKIYYKETSIRTKDFVTYINTINTDNLIEKNLILVLPEKFLLLDKGIILSGNSKKYEKEKDFRTYTEYQRKTIIDAMKKICNLNNKKLINDENKIYKLQK